MEVLLCGGSASSNKNGLLGALYCFYAAFRCTSLVPTSNFRMNTYDLPLWYSEQSGSQKLLKLKTIASMHVQHSLCTARTMTTCGWFLCCVRQVIGHQRRASFHVSTQPLYSAQHVCFYSIGDFIYITDRFKVCLHLNERRVTAH